MPKVTELDHLVLTVGDIGATVQFYETALGMHAQTFQVADGTTRQALTFGGQKINLHPVTGPYAPHAAQPVPGSADLCFLSDTPVADWVAHLTALGVPVETGPVRRTGATGPILSIYLRDPDGTLIEVANRLDR